MALEAGAANEPDTESGRAMNEDLARKLFQQSDVLFRR